MRANLQRVRRNGDDGFTLIELLIVIVILGILAAIVVFSVQGITNKGDNAACRSDVATIETAQEAYYAGDTLGNGAYAGDVATLHTKGLVRSVPNSAKYEVTTSTSGVVVVHKPTVAADAPGTDDTNGAKAACAGIS